MSLFKTQDDISISGDHSKVVGGNDLSQVHHHHYASKKTRLAILFEKLRQEYDAKNETETIGYDLQRLINPRDTIGLEQKLRDGDRSHLLDDAKWLKEEYWKKLTRFQFFEPAQEIHAFILGIVLEKFRHIVYPAIRRGSTEVEVSSLISNDIVAPIIKTIQEEGCHNIMGLSSTDIEGMIFFLTGRCPIRWKL